MQSRHMPHGMCLPDAPPYYTWAHTASMLRTLHVPKIFFTPASLASSTWQGLSSYGHTSPVRVILVQLWSH